jgi:hypothetical protein
LVLILPVSLLLVPLPLLPLLHPVSPPEVSESLDTSPDPVWVSVPELLVAAAWLSERRGNAIDITSSKAAMPITIALRTN